MTKSFALFKSDIDTFYFTYTKRLHIRNESQKDDLITVHAVCLSFVNSLYGSTPNNITLTASTENFDGAIKIFVVKSGFYRWDFLFPQKSLYHGLFPYAEEQLNRFFPNAKEDGLDHPHDLFIKFNIP